MSDNWINKILRHEETPPQGVWMNIANELDNDDKENSSSLTTKILAYEAEPPVTALANIFTALDKKQTDDYPIRMYHHEEEPPVSAWKNIAGQLDNENAAPVISFERKKNNVGALYIRIAAAAAVITIIIATVLLNSKEQTTNINEPVATLTPQSQQSKHSVIDTVKSALPAADSQEKTSNNAKENSAQQPQKKLTEQELPVIDYVKGNEVIALAPNPVEANKEKLQNSKGETPQDIALMNTPNTYISITGPDGQVVKVSSKFANLIGYLTDKNNDTQENLDIIIKESAKWRTTFAVWRDKMTNNVVAPSLGNFMDIIELSKVLEEKK